MNTLGHSEETFRILAESLPIMVWSARSDGSIEYFNPHALAFTGLPAEELCGWGWRKLIYPEDVPRAQAAWDQAVQSGKPYIADHRIRRNDGHYYWVAARGRPVRTQDGQVQRRVGTFAEIQGKRHAMEDPACRSTRSNHEILFRKTICTSNRRSKRRIWASSSVI
jgi:PAS domain S-box-containing protein